MNAPVSSRGDTEMPIITDFWLANSFLDIEVRANSKLPAERVVLGGGRLTSYCSHADICSKSVRDSNASCTHSGTVELAVTQHLLARLRVVLQAKTPQLGTHFTQLARPFECRLPECRSHHLESDWCRYVHSSKRV